MSSGGESSGRTQKGANADGALQRRYRYGMYGDELVVKSRNPLLQTQTELYLFP